MVKDAARTLAVGAGLVLIVGWLGRPSLAPPEPVTPLGSGLARAPAGLAPLSRLVPAAPAASGDAPLAYPPCKPPDPVGLGPWAPYQALSLGEIAWPQRGGARADGGMDVLLHFHGHEAARKTFVQASRGAVFVGVDLGSGSDAYARAFPTRREFDEYRREIEAALRAARGPTAHVAHLGLSAWSAGYGAVLEILRHGARVDAVVLLDGLHTGWKRGRVVRPTADDFSEAGVAPAIDYARAALGGQGTFVFTHTEIATVDYASTSETAILVLGRLGLAQTPRDPGGDPFGLLASADQGGAHVWSYRGKDAPAHCAQLARLATVLSQVVEPAWDTPALDRTVPATPAPAPDRLGSSNIRGGAPRSGGIELELVGPGSAPAPRGYAVDTGGLEPVDLE